MKKFFAIFIISALLLALCACSAEEVPAPDLGESEESESGESSASSETEEEPKEVFIELENVSEDWDSNPFKSAGYRWNSDNSLTYLDGNKIITVSYENEVIDRVELPKEIFYHEGVFVAWDENYIYASRQSGEAFLTKEGKLYITGYWVFDWDGNVLWEIENPAPEKGEVLFSGIPYWIGETRAIFLDSFYAISYDFETGECEVLHNMDKFQDFGKDMVYFGVGSSYGNGEKVYYHAFLDEEKSNSAGNLWATAGEASVMLCPDLEFTAVSFHKDFAVMFTSDTDGYTDSCYYMLYSTEEAVHVGDYECYLPTVFGDYLCLIDNTYENQEDNVRLVCYNTKTGETFIYDTGDDLQTDFHYLKEEKDGLNLYYSKFIEGEKLLYCYNSASDEVNLLPIEEKGDAHYYTQLFRDWLSPDGKYYIEFTDYEALDAFCIKEFKY